MTSKYDSYWTKLLTDIRAAINHAASGSPMVLELPGLVVVGERESWYGAAEVCGHEVIRSSMAHARSLGKVVAAEGVCATWPAFVFRFTIAKSGDTLTVSAVERGPAATDVSPPGGSYKRSAPPGPAGPDVGLAVQGGVPQGGSEPDGMVAADMFYRALDWLAEIIGGRRLLRDCHGGADWPRLGVYFFFEPGEVRSAGHDRVVRVGTHALTRTSQATLWGRLRQHRGQLSGLRPGGGNHRASVFRRHVGAAIIRREQPSDGLLDSWLDRHGPRPGWAEMEAQIERAVSDHIGAMPFLWLSVPDRSDRGFIERNSIGLVSCLAGGLDQPSAGWLGHHAVRADIRQSGLWNVDHVRHRTEPGFIDRLGQLIEQQSLHRASAR